MSGTYRLAFYSDKDVKAFKSELSKTKYGRYLTGSSIKREDLKIIEYTVETRREVMDLLDSYKAVVYSPVIMYNPLDGVFYLKQKASAKRPIRETDIRECSELAREDPMMIDHKIYFKNNYDNTLIH